MLDQEKITQERAQRAQAIKGAGGIEEALDAGTLAQYADITLSEAIVLGLIRQNVTTFLGIFGHGSTEVGEVLRVYEEEGLVKTYPVRHETEAVHAATALRWVTGKKACVFTSIGPGAMHALAGSLAPLSDGLGVWFLLGDETTEDEGPNMQQIPGHEQNLFLQLFGVMGNSYMLHTPEAVSVALRRGLNTVDHPYRQEPFYLLLPMNTQPKIISDFNIRMLPKTPPPPLGPAADHLYDIAVEKITTAQKVVIKIGGGAREAGDELIELLDLSDGVAVTSPLISGIIPFWHERNMTVGGSKGTLSGNYAMEEADLLIAVGSRFVCQSDCSRTGYPKVQHVININGDVGAATHYTKTTAMIGDITATLKKLNAALKSKGAKPPENASEWFKSCRKKREEWDRFREQRYDTPELYDETWKREVLTQPAAIKAASDWARKTDAVSFYDAGDVQANGFQIVEDDRLGRTFTETGASYMGFAASSVLATALSDSPFYALAMSGDGSFMMNPQILIDGVEHGAKGCIVVLDNRRMAAISGLQLDQYGKVYATGDSVEVDYVALANAVKGVKGIFGGYTTDSFIKALDEAKVHDGLSVIHVPVYCGPNPLGGMGVFGRWNVGNWCTETQCLRREIGL